MRINVDIPATLVDELDGVADEAGRSRSAVIKALLGEALYGDDFEDDEEDDDEGED